MSNENKIISYTWNNSTVCKEMLILNIIISIKKQYLEP